MLAMTVYAGRRGLCAARPIWQSAQNRARVPIVLADWRAPPVDGDAERSVNMARVLLIDDDQSNVEFMRQLLSMEGHEMVWAADGNQGLALVRKLRPDLIICDVIMPHLGGFAVLETVRADPEFVGVPVILFSAAMDKVARDIALRHGAKEVLAKPFTLVALRDAIRRCLSGVGA